MEQKNLEKRYEELIEERAAMKGMVNKIKYKEVQEEIQDVSRALRESTNNLVRSLKDNPNVSGAALLPNIYPCQSQLQISAIKLK